MEGRKERAGHKGEKELPGAQRGVSRVCCSSESLACRTGPTQKDTVQDRSYAEIIACFFFILITLRCMYGGS